MTNKSHVSLEKNQCIVCGKLFDTGAILLDRRLKQSLEICTVTGYGLCSEDQTKFDEGYIALVECDAEKSNLSSNTDSVKPEQVYRTGSVAHLKRNVFHNVFNASLDEGQAVVFVEQGVIQQLQAMTESA